MDLISSCKDKLQYFRIKELKEVLTQLGLSKQGKKQDLVDRILAILAEDQVPKMWAKRQVGREDVARLVDDTHRKMQDSGATDLATKGPGVADSSTLKPKEEIDDSYQLDMKIRCLCGSSLLTDSMIKCEDLRCQVWQHISCAIIPDKPTEGIPQVPTQFYCEVCRLGRADPFWSTVTHPLYPVKLMTTNIPTDGTNPVQGVEKTFQLTRADRDMLSKPEYDVQAWCMLLNDKVPFRMHWPQYADLQVNGVPVRAINRPGAQLLGANGRDDGPIITTCTRDGLNKISLTGSDGRTFCLGVRIVRRRTMQQILSMIPKESNGELFEDALARVRRCVGGGGATDNADSDSDLEVVADSITVNLRCPMSGSRMKIAGRFKPCAHMGCFDLETFVEMNQRSRKWQCPVCLKNYSLENVVIDPYFNRITSMLSACGEDSAEIEVRPDGSWRVKNDKERRDLRQWHLPDGSLFASNVTDVRPKSEPSKLIKQEGTGLKLGIRRRNGLWEVSKQEDMNTPSSSERVQEKHMTNGHIIPMSSSATGSGRDDDPSVDQGANGNFDCTAGVELDSTSLNLESVYGYADQDASAAPRDADVIVLSDSDGDNDDVISRGAIPVSGQTDTNVVFPAAHREISDTYQDETALGNATNSCFDLVLPSDDDFAMHNLWPLPPATQGSSSFELFNTDTAAADALIGLQGSINFPAAMNVYTGPSEATMNPAALVPETSVGHDNHELNDGLVDNPLALGADDPALQIFLPTKPSDASVQSDLRTQQDPLNPMQNEDWISLRLGGGGGSAGDDANHGGAGGTNGFNSEYELPCKEGSVNSQIEAASLFRDSHGRSDRARQRSDSPFSFSRPQRSVRPKLYFSLDSDSE